MKKLLITIGLLIACQWLAAQNLPLIKPIDDYSFAHFERNHLLYPGDSTAMERFFQKLDSVVFLGEGNVNIMHIGGSHVQAGVFTQQFRDNLLNIGTDLMLEIMTQIVPDVTEMPVPLLGWWHQQPFAFYGQFHGRMGLYPQRRP